MSVSRGTVHSIQFLRFVAAASVVIYHAHAGLATGLVEATSAEAAYWLRFGAVGVHVFFVISGYIMYLTNFARPVPFSTQRFLARRLIRVYPTYWSFVALYLAAEALLGTLPDLDGARLTGMLALAPDDAPRVIGPAWTLSYEIFFYLVFGLVMRLGERLGPIVLTLLFLAAIGIGRVLHPSTMAGFVATNPLLLEFVAGVWIARLTGRGRAPGWLGWVAVAAAVAGYAAGLAWGYDRLPSAIAWGVPSALLIAGAVVLERTAPENGGGILRRLSRLGDSSFSLYLCHILLVTLVATALRALGLAPPLLFLVPIVTIGCIVIAACFYRWVERPMVASLHRLTERRGTQAKRGVEQRAG